MAYASLVVVTKVIDQILTMNDHHYSFVCTKDQMSSLREKVVGFQEFFEHVSGRPHYSSEVDELESRIRDAAYKMENMIEYILLWSFDLEDEADDLQLSVSPGQFASLIEQANQLLGEAMEIKKKIYDNKPVTSGTFGYSQTISATTL